MDHLSRLGSGASTGSSPGVPDATQGAPSAAPAQAQPRSGITTTGFTATPGPVPGKPLVPPRPPPPPPSGVRPFEGTPLAPDTNETVAEVHDTGTATLGTQTRSAAAALKRITKLFTHAEKLLDAVMKQADDALFNANLPAEVNDAAKQLRTAHKTKLEEFTQRFSNRLKDPDDQLSKKEVALLKKELKALRKETAEKIRDIQIATLKQILLNDQEQFIISEGLDAADTEGIAKFEEVARQGGKLSSTQKLHASYRKAHRQYRAAVGEYEKQVGSQLETKAISLSQQGTSRLQQDIIAEVTNPETATAALKRRGGVVVLNPTSPDPEAQLYVRLSTTTMAVIKQIEGLESQSMTAKDRTTITGQLGQVADNHQVVSTPLNDEFDSAIGKGGHFGGIFGRKGVSSKHRAEKHLVNAWKTEVRDQQGKTRFRAFRHAVLAGRRGAEYQQLTPERRQEVSQEMAKELVTAMVMQEMADSGRSALDLSADSPLVLNISSVCLLTPTKITRIAHALPGAMGRKLGRMVGEDERQFIKDQMAALNAMEELGTIRVGDQDIPVQLTVMPFNFGVNKGALGMKSKGVLRKMVGLAKQASTKGGQMEKVKLGVDLQWDYNLQAMEKLKTQFGQFEKAHNEWKAQTMHGQSATADEISQREATYQAALAHMNSLRAMMKSKRAYMKVGNQYEAGARVLCLSNLMGVSHQCSFNCKSGKDRTGFMAGVAQAFNIIHTMRGKVPTTAELQSDEELRKQFVEILVEVLMEGGGLDIADLNADVRGYQVSAEAMIYEMLPEIFDDIQGLSKMI